MSSLVTYRYMWCFSQGGADEKSDGEKNASWVPLVLKVRLTEQGQVEVEQAKEEPLDVSFNIHSKHLSSPLKTRAKIRIILLSLWTVVPPIRTKPCTSCTQQ